MLIGGQHGGRLPPSRLAAAVKERQPELRHLRESLGITQPAVSIAVRHLEDSIGIALFERTARGMMPTPAGAALALRVKRALAEIRHAAADIASLRGITQGT